MTSTKEWSIDLTLPIACTFTCTAALMVNLFIAAVDFPDWLKGRKINACEKVQCVLALSRMWYGCISLIRLCIAVSGHGDALVINHILSLIHISNNFTGLWYLTLLSLLFFLKAAACKHALFTRLKIVMSRRLMRFIVGVTLISICNAILSVCGFQSTCRNTPPHILTNVTCQSRNPMSFLYAAAVGNSGPFIIYSVSTVMLVSFVCRHVIQMRSSEVGLSRSNLDSYYVAIKSLAICFLIYVLQVGANIVGAAYYSCFGLSGFFILSNIFPNLHSVYLIYRNPKLRHRFSETIQGAANCLTKRGSPDSTLTGRGTNIAE